MSKITFAEDAWEEYLYWQLQDKRTFMKFRYFKIKNQPGTERQVPGFAIISRKNIFALPAEPHKFLFPDFHHISV